MSYYFLCKIYIWHKRKSLLKSSLIKMCLFWRSNIFVFYFRWCLVALCSFIWLMKLVISVYHLYYAYDTKLFYNHALKIREVSVVFDFETTFISFEYFSYCVFVVEWFSMGELVNNTRQSSRGSARASYVCAQARDQRIRHISQNTQVLTFHSYSHF